MASKIVVNLDTSVNNTISAQCKQNDDLTLEASIFENGIEKDLTNCFVIINGRKADLTPVIQDEYIIKEGNKLYVQLNKDFTRVPGVTLIEVVTVEEGKQNTTYHFVLVVDSSVIRSSLESGPNITALERLVDTVIEAKEVNEEAKELTKEVKELNEETKQLIPEAKKSKEDLIVLIPEATPMINALKELIPEAGELNDIIKEKLEEYSDNEETRKRAEENRNVSESNRNTKETERKTKENERISNENLRVNKETERITSEEERKSKEEIRKTKEDERIEHEKARGEAETKREYNENSRKISEDTRATNEEARKTKENERTVAETNRATAEGTRVSAEKTRGNNEAERQLKEQDRLNAEEERKTNEIARKTAYEEITGAREDYFGEGHNDLEERLNSDFDNIHQRVNESSLLPYEGTNITANDSYYGLVRDEVIKGMTLQNLCEGNDISPITRYIYKKELKNIKNSTKYTVWFKLMNVVKGDYTGRFSVSIENTPQMPSTGVSFENGMYTVSITTKDSTLLDTTLPIYINFWTQYIDVGQTYQISEVMVLEGDHTNESIQFFEGIQSVGEQEITEDGKYKVSIKSCGRNLFDGKMESGVINSTTGLNADNTSHIRCVNYTKVKKNTDYVLTRSITTSTMPIRFYDANKVFDANKTSTIESGKNTVKFNTGDSVYIRFMQWNYNELNIQVQLEEGTVATEHEPYQETTQEYLLDQPLRGLPNYVCDTIEDGKPLINTIEFNLNGSETWNRWTGDTTGWTGTNKYGYSTELPVECYNTSDSHISAICDKYPVITYYLNWYNTNTRFGISLAANVQNRITKKLVLTSYELKTVTELKDWLRQNNLKVLLALAETNIISVDNKDNLKSYEGTTHITSDNLLPPTISCKIPSNVPAVVSSLRIENEGLTNEVETLTIENEILQETSNMQDNAIDVSMIATDTLYTLLDSIVNPASTIDLLNETNQEFKEVNRMVDFYVVMVQRGLKKKEDVPERYREEVIRILDAIEK